MNQMQLIIPLYVDTSWEGMKYRDENDGATAGYMYT